MVLDNATAESDVVVDVDSPGSDTDYYADASSSASSNLLQVQKPPYELFIPYDQLPQPFGFASAANQRARLQSLLRRRCGAYAEDLRRPLRQEEADAASYNLAHGLMLASIGEPLGYTIGALQWLRQPGRMTFVGGWAPGREGGRFQPDNFFGVRGSWARTLWRLSAGGSQLGLWSIGLGIVFASYGMTTAVVRDARDPRLKERNQLLARKAAERAKKATEKQDTTTQPETFEQRRQRVSVQTAAKNAQHDDASPTGGLFASDYSDNNTRSDFITDAVASQSDNAWQGSAQARQPDRPAQKPKASRDAMDEMSEDRKPAQSTGSAWGRLRQEAMGGKTQAQARKDDRDS